MRLRQAAVLLLLLVVTGCASQRVVRLEVGQGRALAYSPPTWDQSVAVEEDAFEDALARLVLELPLSLRPVDAGWWVRASSHGRTMDAVMQGALRRDYGRWCRAHEAPGDCLSLLEDGLRLDAGDRLKVALGLSLDPMHESIADAVEETLNPTFFKAVVVSALVSWVVLAAAPEPLFTKAAAVVAVVMLAYMGGDAFLALVAACRELHAAAGRATTFQELEEAGERFGRVMGTEGARVFVLAMALVVGGGTAGGTTWLASRMPLLPGFAEASALGAVQAGVNLAAIEQVSAVAVVDGTLAITLAPAAVAMAARGDTEDHHLATIRNEKSTARGGPWTPRFRAIFKKAGMDLDDAENIVPVAKHKGPHPQEYHEAVFRELDQATKNCRTVKECRAALEAILKQLAEEVATPGSELNLLITR